MSKAEPRANLHDYVLNAIDAVVRKAQVMSCKYEREKVRAGLGGPRWTCAVQSLTLSIAQPAAFCCRSGDPVRDAAHHRRDFADQPVQGRTYARAYALDAILLHFVLRT